MTPGAILLWAQVVMEFGTLAERFAALSKRIHSGEEVTEEELKAARVSRNEAVDAWNDAGEHDKENDSE